MSGGTDSSMAAYLLRERGHEVVGLTMRLWREASGKSSEQHISNAQAVAAKLGVTHEVVDFLDAFESTVVEPFVNAYRQGDTPSPCICCNMRVKFGLLLEHALARDCSALATGHYARIAGDASGRLGLLRGRDPSKDQSYFLFGLRQDQLRCARFPLGDLSKEEVRRRTTELSLVPHRQKESQDLCFIPDDDYAGFIARRCPALSRSGPIVDLNGRQLGEHMGTFRYTIGQRRGLGLGGGPWHVVEILAAANTVVVGRKHDLLARDVDLKGTHWICDPPAPGTTLSAGVQLRHNMDPVAARITVTSPDTASLCLEAPSAAITPGQAAVFYDGERVLGGGWIRRNVETNLPE